MSILYERPIPGQSLTETPKNMPFERPPESAQPEVILNMYKSKLSEEGALEDLFDFIERGVDIKTMVQGMLRSGVMEGLHSIDVSLIIAPFLHKIIVDFCDIAEVKYKDGFIDEERKQVLEYQKRDIKISGELENHRKELDEKERFTQFFGENLEEEMPEEIEEEIEEPMEKTVVGLMERV